VIRIPVIEWDKIRKPSKCRPDGPTEVNHGLPGHDEEVGPEKECNTCRLRSPSSGPPQADRGDWYKEAERNDGGPIVKNSRGESLADKSSGFNYRVEPQSLTPRKKKEGNGRRAELVKEWGGVRLKQTNPLVKKKNMWKGNQAITRKRGREQKRTFMPYPTLSHSLTEANSKGKKRGGWISLDPRDRILGGMTFDNRRILPGGHKNLMPFFNL